MILVAPPVHPHIRGVYFSIPYRGNHHNGPSPHTWGLRQLRSGNRAVLRSIPTYVGFTVHSDQLVGIVGGPSPHTWGLPLLGDELEPNTRSIPTYVGFTVSASLSITSQSVHPHIRGVYTEIKSKISRASSKTALLPAEKFKILFLVKIKSSAAAFQVHTIFRDQFPPGLHFEIALHL